MVIRSAILLSYFRINSPCRIISDLDFKTDEEFYQPAILETIKSQYLEKFQDYSNSQLSTIKWGLLDIHFGCLQGRKNADSY
jgi:hypothetical protein